MTVTSCLDDPDIWARTGSLKPLALADADAGVMSVWTAEPAVMEFREDSSPQSLVTAGWGH